MTSYTAKYLRYYFSLGDLRMIKVVGASFSCDCPTGYWGNQCEFSPCVVAATAPPRCTAGTKKRVIILQSSKLKLVSKI